MARPKLEPLMTVAEAKARLLEWSARPEPSAAGPRLGGNPVHFALAALAAGFLVSAFLRRQRGGLFLMTALFGRSLVRMVVPTLIGAVVKRATR
jgi:hypothetical protein